MIGVLGPVLSWLHSDDNSRFPMYIYDPLFIDIRPCIPSSSATNSWPIKLFQDRFKVAYSASPASPLSEYVFNLPMCSFDLVKIAFYSCEVLSNFVIIWLNFTNVFVELLQVLQLFR